MKKHEFVPEATSTKKLATEINLPLALVKRLVDYYNANMYMDNPLKRVKMGHRDSQVQVGLSIRKLSHLRDIAMNAKHPDNYNVTCILAAAGYLQALGGDAITSHMLAE